MTHDAIDRPDFASLRLLPALLTAVQKLGFTHPTPIQLQAIPAILKGQDVRAKAQTGSGKTAAFGLPLLQRLVQRRGRPLPAIKGNQVGVLILAPTRELVEQIAMDLKAYASHITPNVKIVSCVGGVNITPQMLALRGGADVLVATPGRLLDLVQQNALKVAQLQALVLDEADRLLQLGFSEELAQILTLLPLKRQNLLFSATFPPEVDALIAGLLVNAQQIECLPAPASLIQQRAITVLPECKNALLAQLIQADGVQQALVFANAKNTCNHLVLKLAKRGIKAMALHGDKTQANRTQVLRAFKQGGLPVLIATDLAARGIDIENLPLVINYDLPRSPNDYIHRIGRTGRASSAGVAISLLTEDDEAHFRIIEKRMKMRLVRERAQN